MKKDKVITFLLALYCSLMPFEEALASSFGSILKPIAVILICYILLTKEVDNLLLKKYQIPLLLWILYNFISFAWADSLNWWMYFFRIYVVQVIFLCVIELVPIKKINIDNVQFGVILGSCIAASIMLLFPNISDYTDEGRRTIMLFNSTLDPNVVASIILLGIQISMTKLYCIRSRKYIGIIILQIIGLLLTGSRGALLSLIGAFFIEMFLKLIYQRNKKNNLKILLFSILLTGLIFLILPKKLLESRFSVENILGLNELESGSHNRYTIWYYSLILIKNNFLLGYGCGNFFSAIETLYKTCASHNLYILILVENGIIGILLFGKYIYNLLRDLYKQHDFSTFSIMLAILIMAMSLDSITYKYFWITLIYVRLMIRKNRYLIKRTGKKYDK